MVSMHLLVMNHVRSQLFNQPLHVNISNIRVDITVEQRHRNLNIRDRDFWCCRLPVQLHIGTHPIVVQVEGPITHTLPIEDEGTVAGSCRHDSGPLLNSVFIVNLRVEGNFVIKRFTNGLEGVTEWDCTF